jgi:hypothetical protein
MPFDTPFRFGPFKVDSQGRMQPSEPGQFPTFHVAWRNVAVHARLDGDGPEGPAHGRLRFSAVVGRVPSTAGGEPAHSRARRAEAFELLGGLAASGDGPWRLRLAADHRLVMEASRDVGLPVSAVDLLTQVTCSLLSLAPYLDLLGEAGLLSEVSGSGASPSTGGTANT